MTTLVTGAGLIGTTFAQNALARGETVVFVDPEPRADFLRLKLGEKGYATVRKDVRDLPGLLETIKSHGAETVVHTAGLIGGRVQQSVAAVETLCPGLSYEVEPGEASHSKLAPLDISAAKRDLGWEPRFTIATAFADYLAELKTARAQ